MGFNLNAFARGLASTDPAGFYLKLQDMQMRQQQADQQQQEFEWRKRDDQQRQDFQKYTQEQMDKVGSTVYDTQYVTPDQQGLEGQTPEQALARQGDAAPTQASVRALDNASTVQSNPRTYTQADAMGDISRRAAGFDLGLSMKLAEQQRQEKTRASIAEISDDMKNLSNAEINEKYGKQISADKNVPFGFRHELDPKTGIDKLIGINQATGDSREVSRPELAHYLSAAAMLGNGDYMNGLATMTQARDLQFKQADADYKRTHGDVLAANSNNHAVLGLDANNIQRQIMGIQAAGEGARARLIDAQIDGLNYDMGRKKTADAAAEQLVGLQTKVNEAYASGNPRDIAAATAQWNTAVARVNIPSGKIPQLQVPGGKKTEPSVIQELAKSYAAQVSGLDPSKPGDLKKITDLQKSYSGIGLDTGYQDPVQNFMPKKGDAFPLGGVQQKSGTQTPAPAPAPVATGLQPQSGVTAYVNARTGERTYGADGVSGRFTTPQEAAAARRRLLTSITTPAPATGTLYGD